MDANDAGDGSSEPESELARKDAEWAAKADMPTPIRSDARGAGDGSSPTVATVRTGQASGPKKYRTPRNLRSTNGPRFSGRGVFAVFGLLGVLLTVGIMVFLFVRVIDGVTGDSTPGAGTDDIQQAPAVPGLPVPDTGGGAEIDPDGSGDAARSASCDAERATIELAAQAYELVHGRAPTLDELVGEGMLQPPEGGFSHELAADGSVAGTGACAPA